MHTLPSQIELEGRRAEVRQNIEIARAKAKERAEQIEKERRALADEAYKNRLLEDKMRVIDPVW